MTARVKRRRRRTIGAGLLLFVLIIAAGAVAAVGVLTLLDSEEGEAVAVDERPTVALPETSNALLTVADDKGRLTSLVVATLDPTGTGGNIVTVPVNADAHAGFDATPAPLKAMFDPDEPEEFREAVEAMLAIAIQRVEVVTADELADLIDPVAPIEVDLPSDLVDSDTAGSGIVVTRGEHTLRRSVVVDALTAFNRRRPAYQHHEFDVEIWSRLADNAPGLEPRVDLDPPPGSVAELFEDLWSGDVDVRDLALSVVVTDATTSTIDAVVVDRRDSLLVFAQISPSLVSKPNQALSFRVVSRFNDEQLATSNDLFESNSELARRFIGELLFYQANVVSADTSPALEGASVETRMEVADARFIDDLEALAGPAFGGAEVVVSTAVLQGVDVIIILGTDYIDYKVELDRTAGDDSPPDDSVPDDLVTSEPATDDTVGADE